MRKGFTLIELLVVVLIIGILAGVALPQYQMAILKTQYATLKDNAHVLKNAMDRYFMVNNGYTNTLEELDVELNGNLVNNNNKVNLPDGSNCFIGGNSIFCGCTKFGVSLLYAVEYTTHGVACISTTEINDRSNRLCQQETGRKTPSIEKDTYNIYYY